MPETLTDTTLRITRTLKATRDQVFRAWTDPEQMKKWMAPGPMTVPSADVDLRVGGKFRIVMNDDESSAEHIAVGEFREITPPKKLVYTWAWEGADEQIDTLVTVELREVKGGTEMTLVHEKFPDAKAKDDHTDGWNGCFAKLEDILAG